MNRVQAVNEILASRDGGTYLEIGVRKGETFRSVVSAGKKVGVDPAFSGRRIRAKALVSRLAVAAHLNPSELLLQATSDEFFRRWAKRVLKDGLSAALIDGLHTADQAYRDVENSLRYLRPDGLIVLHDCNPLSAAAGAPSRKIAGKDPDFAGLWNGDVYKAIVRLRRDRPDLDVSVLDCDQGLGIVRRSPNGAASRTLETINVDDLTYDDLAANREHLLGLRPPDDFASLIAVP